MQSEEKISPWVRKMMQQETGELKESEDGNAEFGTPTDDEEVTIPSRIEISNFPNTDIRDEETLSNTRRLATTYGAPA